jgi:hypothetical protein
MDGCLLLSQRLGLILFPLLQKEKPAQRETPFDFPAPLSAFPVKTAPRGQRVNEKPHPGGGNCEAKIIADSAPGERDTTAAGALARPSLPGQENRLAMPFDGGGMQNHTPRLDHFQVHGEEYGGEPPILGYGSRAALPTCSNCPRLFSRKRRQDTS